MELSVGNNIPVDLMDGAEASIDYEIFSDKVTNLVSTVTGLDLPSTDKNLAAITAGTRQDAELSSEFGSSFIGQINVDSQSFNSVDDVINITFFEKLKTIFDDMDITIGDICNDKTFDWNFDRSGDIPLLIDKGDWFLSSADFNGFSDNGNDMNNISIYPSKVISHKNQMFWTISIYSFITKVLQVYDIGHDIKSTDIMFNKTKISDLYMFIPVTKFVCTSRELSKRNLGVSLQSADKSSSDDGLCWFSRTQTPTINGIEQTYVDGSDIELNTQSIIGTSDTSYTMSIYDFGGIFGKLNVKSEHTGINGVTPVVVPYGNFETGKTQGTVDAILEVYNNDSVIKEIKLVELFNGLTGDLNTTKENDFELVTFDMDLLAADDLQFRVNLRFNNYYFYDLKITGFSTTYVLKRIDGVYSHDELDDICLNVNAPSIAFSHGAFPLTSITVQMTATDQLVPIRREYEYSSDLITDEIDINKSLEHTGVLVKDLLEDINKRYNLGYWIDSSNKLRVSTINTRYDNKSTVSLYESSGEPYTIEYLIDTVGSFEYTNNVNGIESLKIENTESNIGDVKETEIGDGDNDISVSLDSSVATNKVYGEPITGDDLPFLDVNLNLYYWGYSNKEQLLPKDTPIMHGYLTEPYKMNVRIPHVYPFNTSDDGEDIFYEAIPAYTANGNRVVSEQEYSEPYIYTPTYVNWNGDSVLLGNDYAELDTTSYLYRNFKYLFDEDQSTITIEGILSHEEMSKLLDGSIAQINGLGGADANYMVLRVEGFLFDQYKSVVKLKIKKYVTSF